MPAHDARVGRDDEVDDDILEELVPVEGLLHRQNDEPALVDFAKKHDASKGRASDRQTLRHPFPPGTRYYANAMNLTPDTRTAK